MLAVEARGRGSAGSPRRTEEVGVRVFDGESGVVALCLRRIRGDQRVGAVEVGEQRTGRGDLVGFVIDLLLGYHDPLGVGHRREQVHRPPVGLARFAPRRAVGRVPEEHGRFLATAPAAVRAAVGTGWVADGPSGAAVVMRASRAAVGRSPPAPYLFFEVVAHDPTERVAVDRSQRPFQGRQ